MTHLEHLLKWIKKQTHVQSKAFADNAEIDRATFSRILSGGRKLNENHYKALLPFCKKIGYKPKSTATGK